METKLALTIEEAAEYTGIGRNTLRQLVRWHSFPVMHIGRKQLIRTDTLNEFLMLNQDIDLRNRSAIRPVPQQTN